MKKILLLIQLFILMAVFTSSAQRLRVFSDKNKQLGFIDSTGKIVIPAQNYIALYNFSEGLAQFRNADKKYGFINEKGVEVIPARFYDADDFSEGLARVFESYDSKASYIDKTGKAVLSTSHTIAGPFKEGLAAVGDKKDKYGYINKTGKLVIPLNYSRADNFSEGRAFVGKGYIYAMIDNKGKELTAYKYDLYNTFSGGLAMVRKEKDFRSFYIDKSDKEKISIPDEWTADWDFADGLCKVKFERPYGKSYIDFIDTNGKFLLQHKKYLDADNKFSEGLIGVKDETGYWLYIDKTGKDVFPFYKVAIPGAFLYGLAKVKLINGNSVFINKNGDKVFIEGK